MNSYDIFSKYYDFFMGDRSKEAAFISSLINSFAPKAKNVLELSCGTGALLKHLSKHYNVSGLDISKPMLEIAQKTLPEITFYQQDMTSFSIPEKFDVILCLFDSVNHLIKFSDWERVFHRSHEHLSANGLFIFDINTEKKLELLASSKPLQQEKNGSSLTMEVKKKVDLTYNWEVKMSARQPDGTFEYATENIVEASFPVNMVAGVLSKIFSKVDIFDSDKKEVSAETGRVYFVCRK